MSTKKVESTSILVFGATGACGRALCAELVSRADESTKVFGFVRDVAKAQKVLPPNVELIQGDMQDAVHVAGAFVQSKARHVFISSSNGQQQVQMETNVITAAKDTGATCIVKLLTATSSLTPELSTATPCLAPEVQSAIGQAHREIEKALGESKVAYSVLRANYFMQNLLKPGLVIGKGYHPSQVRGEGGGVGVLRSHYAHQKISMVDVRDVAAVAAALLLDAEVTAAGGKRVFDVTGPDALTMSQVAAEMSQVWGRDVTCEALELQEALQELVSKGVMPLPAATSLGNFLTCVGQECDFIETECVSQIGDKAPTRLSEFLKDYAHAFDSE